MQTFLPYSDFRKSLECLDPKRLGNQVYREGLTLLRGKWPNHPASKMWRGYEDALAAYIWFGLDVLQDRDKNYGHHYAEVIPFLRKYEQDYNADRGHLEPRLSQIKMPEWLGNEAFHASHRSNLLRKDPEWYGQFGWTEPDDLPYVWPITTE